MPRSRRAVLAGVATVGLAGCLDELGLGGGPSAIRDEAVDERTPIDGGQVGEGYEVQLAIPDGRYWVADIDLNLPGIATAVFNAGGDMIDVVLLPISEYRNWDDGDEVRYENQFASLGVTEGFVSGRVSEGQHRLVIDNSSRGEADPDGEVRVGVRYGWSGG